MSRFPASLIEVDLSGRERRRILEYAQFSFSLNRVKSADSTLWKRANRRKTIVPQRVRDALWMVGTHDGPDALILRRAVTLPWRGLTPLRNGIIDGFDKGDWEESGYDYLVYRTMRQLTVLMASVGYHALVQCYHSQPNFIFHAKAKEDTLPDKLGYPHKLPTEPSTISPNLPLSPALFGPRRSTFDGSYTPDIAAFVMLETRPHWTIWNRELGPHLYFIEDIEAAMQPVTLNALRERQFTIRPDPSMGICPQEEGDNPGSNPFGTAINVNLFGRRDVSGHEYMRFSLEGNRLTGANPAVNDRQQYIAALKAATDKLRSDGVAQRCTLQRGDVLFVNNRRVATHWAEKCRHSVLKSGWRGKWEEKVKKGDRVVFQMNFYYPEEVEPQQPAVAAK
jgi:hypothetical protein